MKLCFEQSSELYYSSFLFHIVDVGYNTYVQSIASSLDGSRLAISGGSGIFISTTQGASWTLILPPYQSWTSITSSSDGLKLAVLSHQGCVYTSTNGGATWKLSQSIQISSSFYQSSPMRITSSSDGLNIAAATYFMIHISSNGGASWKTISIPGASSWSAIVSSSDGSRIAASASSGGGIYISSDAGATWNKTLTSDNSMSIATSSDGLKLVVVGPGAMYNSVDGGATWSQMASQFSIWSAVPIASSSDGSKLAIYTSLYSGLAGIYISVDSGMSWNQTLATNHVSALNVSPDGSVLTAILSAAGGGANIVYVSVDGGLSWRIAL